MFLFSTTGAVNSLQGALARASRATGAGFDYLLGTAARESNLNPVAKAPTSSATGLFQFIESTWLGVVKEDGPKHGLQAYAAAIRKTPDGRYQVADPARRQEILALRTDPETAAKMAGELTRRNGEALSATLGRKPTDGELYAAHVLGSAGAARLIGMAENRPNVAAATAFPEEAGANRGLFYHPGGRARSAGELHALLSRPPASRPSSGASAQGAEGEEATAEPLPGAGFGDRFARASRDNDPVFHGLFGTGKVQPVNAYVAANWTSPGLGSRASPAEEPEAPKPARAPPPGPATDRPLDLLPRARPARSSREGESATSP